MRRVDEHIVCGVAPELEHLQLAMDGLGRGEPRAVIDKGVFGERGCGKECLARKAYILVVPARVVVAPGKLLGSVIRRKEGVSV
jgi:hypothetical protein